MNDVPNEPEIKSLRKLVDEESFERFIGELIHTYLQRYRRETKALSDIRSQTAEEVSQLCFRTFGYAFDDFLADTTGDFELKFVRRMLGTDPKCFTRIPRLLEEIISDEEDRERIQRAFFSFRDLIYLDEGAIRTLLGRVDRRDLVRALKDQSDELKARIYSNLPEGDAYDLKTDIAYIGPVRRTDIDGAQQRILNLVRELERTGELVIRDSDENDPMVE